MALGRPGEDVEGRVVAAVLVGDRLSRKCARADLLRADCGEPLDRRDGAAAPALSRGDEGALARSPIVRVWHEAIAAA